MKEFYIGCDVVCLKTKEGFFKKGDIVKIKGLKDGCCSETKLSVDVGVYIKNSRTYCSGCGTKNEFGVQWYCSSLFIPLDDMVDISELTEVLNEPIFK